MRRYLLSILLAAAMSGLFFAPSAQALTVGGGTTEQRAWVREAITAQEYPPYQWTDSYFSGVDVEILDHYPPYWEIAALGDDVFIDIFAVGVVGLAWPGAIKIYSGYPPGPYSFLGEIAVHEWSHEQWFRLPAGARQDWIKNQSPGDSSDWYHNSAESFAEQNRVAAWSERYYRTKTPRTQLRILGDAAVLAWVAQSYEATTTTSIPPTTTTSSTTTTLPPTTTTTLPPTTTTTTTETRGNPFLDVDRSDLELWDAAWWAKDVGVFVGYPNGHFEPGRLLTRHQVGLVADRWKAISLPGLLADWDMATRADVRDALPGLSWLEERWDEYITRSQMLRLTWRAR